MARNESGSKKRIGDFSDEPSVFSDAERQAIKEARAARNPEPESDTDYLESHNRKKTVRDLGKGVQADLRQTVKRKGGSDRVMGGVTNAIYDEMGGSPEPKGKRDKWSNKDLQRTAVNEHMAKNEINHRHKDGRVAQNAADQRHLDSGIVDAARAGARAGESLQNDPETGVSTGGWFGWLFGSEAEKEPDPVQYEIPLDTAKSDKDAKDPDREWTTGDVAKFFFLGKRD